MMKVIKRNKKIEDFNAAKISKVLRAAGLLEKEANDLAERTEKYFLSLHKQTITSREIRDKVIEELTKVNNYVAGLYKWYQQIKERDANLQK